MHIDASGIAIGAILTQPGDDGMDYPIVYSSRKLNKAERNYSTTEREALGMVFALQKYRHYLLANPSIFYTTIKLWSILLINPFIMEEFVDGYFFSKNLSLKSLFDRAS